MAAEDPLIPQLRAVARLDWGKAEQFERFPELLSLRTVDLRCAGATETPYRLGALREAITEAITRLGDDDHEGTRSLSEAANLLMAPQATVKPTLEARRQAVADAWKVRPESFRRHLESSIYEALARELRAMSGGQGDPAAEVSQQLVLNTLERHYVGQPNLSTLASAVVSNKPYYKNLAVDITLTNDSVDEGAYQQEFRLGFEAEIDEYVIAWVTRVSLSRQVLARCPEVNDTWAFSDNAGRERYLKQITTPGYSPVRCIRLLTTGLTHADDLVLRPVDAVERAAYLRYLEPQFHEEVILLKAPIPTLPGESTVSPSVRLTTAFKYPMRRSDGYCYWSADRPTYARRLTVDASQLSPPLPGLTVIPFLGPSAIAVHHDPRRIWAMNVDNWLLPGQGLVARWDSANPSIRPDARH